MTQRRFDSSQQGFTLLEVLVAITLLSLVAAAMAPAFVGQLITNRRSEVRTEAMAVAQQVLDGMRSNDPSTLPSTGSDPVFQRDGGEKTFDVLVSYCVNPDFCTARSRHITVSLSYMDQEVYEIETIFTRLR